MIFSEIEEAMNKLFLLKQKPDAIFTTSDKLTLGCMKTISRRGLMIPDDIAIAGFSNTDIAELINPPLTLVRQPAEEMGRAATELLVQLIESKRPVTEFEKRVLIPELQVRGSSVPTEKKGSSLVKKQKTGV
jgi:DNA-binding LacI/PurR family transcriptional regulator